MTGRGLKNEWGAKRLREGCLKDRDNSNPFTPPPRPGAKAKPWREVGVSSTQSAYRSAACTCTTMEQRNVPSLLLHSADFVEK